ncbi:MAG: isochorismatase family protein [Actinomycetota bacterium]
MTVPGTEPYPWPYDGPLDPQRTALLICGAGVTWAIRTHLDPRVERALDDLRRVAADVGALTVLIHHDAPHGRPATDLPERPAPKLTAHGHEHLVTAAGIDGFYGSELDPLLHRHRRDQLLVVGRGLETTVHSTLRRANDRGYECLTVADACAAVDPDLRAASLSSICMSGGIFGAVGSVAATISTLRAAAGADAPVS